MSFKEIKINHSYISCGEDTISEALVSPALMHAISYKRTAAYFSSTVFEYISKGIISLCARKGSIQLICGPELSQEDSDAIDAGYTAREERARGIFSKVFEYELESYSDKNLKLLFELISKQYLEIKVAFLNGAGIYHDKLGILEDSDGNRIVYYGSANATGSAYGKNYEKIRVISNVNGDSEVALLDEEKEFDDLWNNTNPYLKVTDFQESAKRIVHKVITSRSGEKREAGVILRDYQKSAIEAWKANNFHGFYVMATGTGKTWTAIYSAKELQKYEECMIVICAPYKHLVKQWSEDVQNVYPSAKTILVSSENSGWPTELADAIIENRYYRRQIIVISTIASFSMERFDKIIRSSGQKKLLIVDEAHRFKLLDPVLKDERYQYLLGLSATPGNGKNGDFVKQLFDFFGGKVFDLPIEKALEKGYLVPYNYYPIFVNSTDDEEASFKLYSQKMAACFENGKCIDPDRLAVLYRARLRVIGMAEEKETRFDEILGHIKEKDHFVVYCGDGKLFDSTRGEEIRHIQFVKTQLHQKGFKPSQFTATENMEKRMELVDGFNKGEFDSLVAIRCLDEGINIPSIEGALVLASNDDYREFVQRRGRILRLYQNKTHANIYDVIVLPSIDTKEIATIELRRFYEYARLSMNYDDNQVVLQDLLSTYNIQEDELLIYSDAEEDLDE